MKKMLVLIAAVCLILTACSGDGTENTTSSPSATPMVVQETPDQSVAARTPMPSPSKAPVPVISAQPTKSAQSRATDTWQPPASASTTKDIETGASAEVSKSPKKTEPSVSPSVSAPASAEPSDELDLTV